MSGWAVFVEEMSVPAENRVGEEGKGFAVDMNDLAYGSLAVSGRLIGLAQACLDHAIAHANERIVGGRNDLLRKVDADERAISRDASEPRGDLDPGIDERPAEASEHVTERAAHAEDAEFVAVSFDGIIARSDGAAYDDLAREALGPEQHLVEDRTIAEWQEDLANQPR